MIAHRHTVRLPLGARATFIATPDGAYAVEWAGDGPPRTSNRRAWRKFVEAYVAARDAFVETVATMTGNAVIVADVPCAAVLPEGRVRAIGPATVH